MVATFTINTTYVKEMNYSLTAFAWSAGETICSML